MIKKLVLLLLLTSLAAAQPVPKTGGKISTIFDYAQELKLSQEQVDKMKAAVADLRKAAEESKVKIGKLEAEYRELLKTEPTLEVARAKLNEIAQVQVDLRVLDLAVSRRVSAVLTPEQLKAWRELQMKKQAQKS